MPMKKITFNALLNHKAHNYKPMQIEVEKVILLYGKRFEQMRDHPLDDWPEIIENRDLMYMEGNTAHSAFVAVTLILFLRNLQNLPCKNRIGFQIVQCFDFGISCTAAKIFLGNAPYHDMQLQKKCSKGTFQLKTEKCAFPSIAVRQR